jgi:hypothetical protein
MGRPAEALAAADRAIAAARKWAESDPPRFVLQKYLAEALRLRGIALRKLARPVEAASALRESIAVCRKLARPTPASDYDLACSLSLLSAYDPDAARSAADEAMAVLRRAVAGGYRNAPHMQADTDLDPIRDRPDFRLLMMDLAMPADPFARDEQWSRSGH